MQLQEYTKLFPKENILVVDFEELKAEPIKLCNKIFQFIGASEKNIDFEKKILKTKQKLLIEFKLR